MRTSSLSSSTILLSRVVVFVCFLSLPSKSNSFTNALSPVAPGVRTIASTALRTRSRPLSLLFMGGYYAEPQEDATLDNQHPRRHMMFGINCFERKLVWQSREGDDDDGDFGGSITYLEPVEDYNDVVQQKRERELLAQQIVNQQFDLSSCRTIVELGASVVSLAAARIQPLHLPTSFGVVAYDFDEIRLRILQYADCYLNPLPNYAARPTIPIQTIHVHIPSLGSDAENSNDHHRSPLELPETTDLVIVTTSMMRHDFYLEENGNDHQAEHNTAERQQVKILQQLLHQATERSIPIVYTASTNPSFP